MNNDPVEREMEFRKRIEQAALAQREARATRRVARGMGSSLGFLARFLARFKTPFIVASLAALPVLFVSIFALGIRWTDAYACSITEAKRSPALIAAIGEPVEPGFFAWSFAYRQEGSTTDAAYSTNVSGPKGAGTLRVQFYRSPVGSSLAMDLEKDGNTDVVHRGPAQCQ